MTVSVVIPTHRRAALLQEALASVFAQTRLPGEVLVVDDAADRATAMAVEATKRAAPMPLRYQVATGGGGVCRSRNWGAEQASGEWIAFLDDDDLWRPSFLERVLTALDRSGADFAMSGLFRHDADAPPQARATPPGLTSATVFAQLASMTGSNCIVRRDVLRSVGGFDPAVSVFNDWDLLVRLIDAGFRYVVVPEPLADWRAHPGDRIATPSLRRADGIDFFLSRYGARMPDWMRRDLRTTALGIHRRHTTGLWHRIRLSLALAAAHGPVRAAARVARSFGMQVTREAAPSRGGAPSSPGGVNDRRPSGSRRRRSEPEGRAGRSGPAVNHRAV